MYPAKQAAGDAYVEKTTGERTFARIACAFFRLAKIDLADRNRLLTARLRLDLSG